MTAWYNEPDPYAAQWLRNLIAAGHIAPGVVDERSILDVRADELAGFTQCHFFAGVGVWSRALRVAGWPDGRPVWTGSCPCQPFSAAGKQKGFDDERHLWPVWHRLIAERRPPIVLGEQVASALDWLDLVSADMEASGYAFAAADLCAAGFGGAHIRQRIYFAATDGLAQPNGGERQRVADGEGRQPNGEATGWEQGDRLVAAGGNLRGLADSEQPRLEGHAGYGDHGDQPGWIDAYEAGSASARGGSGRLANAYRLGHDTRLPGDAGSEEGARGEHGNLDDRRGPLGRVAEPQHERHDRSRAAGAAGAAGSRWAHAAGLSRDDRVEPAHAPLLGRHPADWLFCRDGKWRPSEPGAFPLVDAAPGGVVPLCPDCRKEKGALNVSLPQLLRQLGWNEGCQAEEVLLDSVPIEASDERPSQFEHRASASAANDAGDAVRSLRGMEESGSSPSGWKPDEQRSAEHHSSLQDMSWQGACDHTAHINVRDVWAAISRAFTSQSEQDLRCCVCGRMEPTISLASVEQGRVGTLRAYGNALDAETASQFVGAVMEAISMQRYTTCGNQILRNGEHFAEATNPGAADAIAIMLNHGTPRCETSIEDVETVKREIWA